MTDKNFMMDAAMKSMLWEEAKGKLRALVAVQGSYQSGTGDDYRFVELDVQVEKFIKHVEGWALHE
ncbi:hypothetical protein PHIN3_13 [Sinorhizobium phage phiN3]|uniref:Uncharacterized protein n=1 Tax=Sinorhizobium phage phiN3 TaxID=1647405 RepID=A0A0F6WCN5_9CAUD|nr:hypothetical protein AVT40_gp013 [Sinorhizobium phage phiN3]AKF13280.1 hypothetical protein PHIN3_13 [Sinorhizobium phage phiN3]